MISVITISLISKIFYQKSYSKLKGKKGFSALGICCFHSHSVIYALLQVDFIRFLQPDKSPQSELMCHTGSPHCLLCKKHTRCIWFTHGLRLYLKTCKIQDGVSQINSLSKGAMTKTVVPKNVQYYSFNVEQWDRVDPLYLAMALFLLSRSKQVDHILT